MCHRLWQAAASKPPPAPTVASAVLDAGSLTVTFAPPAENGGLRILSYTVKVWRRVAYVCRSIYARVYVSSA